MADALTRRADRRQRRYTLTVDDTLIAIVVTGRDRADADSTSPAALTARLRPT